MCFAQTEWCHWFCIFSKNSLLLLYSLADGIGLEYLHTGLVDRSLQNSLDKRTFSRQISFLGKQKTEKVWVGKGQAHNFWLCQKTNKYEKTSESGNLGGSETYDLVQATSKRLHQLLILLRWRLTQELCLMNSLALWEAALSSLSSASVCTIWRRITAGRLLVSASLHKRRVKHNKIETQSCWGEIYLQHVLEEEQSTKAKGWNEKQQHRE